MAVVTMELVYMEMITSSQGIYGWRIEVPTEYMVIVVIIVVCKAITVVEIILFREH